ncbi:MAG: 30S ribosomal protein S17 [Candidatus Paceibacterota bacterium]
MADTNTKQSNPKKLHGVVVSTNMDKTAVVSVSRFEKHPKYLKYIKKEGKQLVHDPEEQAQTGDKVIIEEMRPVSKRKRFRIKEIKNN